MHLVFKFTPEADPQTALKLTRFCFSHTAAEDRVRRSAGPSWIGSLNLVWIQLTRSFWRIRAKSRSVPLVEWFPAIRTEARGLSRWPEKWRSSGHLPQRPDQRNQRSKQWRRCCWTSWDCVRTMSICYVQSSAVEWIGERIDDVR